MKRIIIIGGGFAGLAAAEKLRALRGRAEVLLIDKKTTSDFLPMLPDVIGGRANPDHLTCALPALAPRLGFRFVHDAVYAVDLEQRQVHTVDHAMGYDYLVIASGSQTNFYGQREIESKASVLDAVEDARNIVGLLGENRHDAIVIAGGGYTGVEVATNIRAHFNRRRLDKRIVLCDLAPAVVRVLPEKLREYVRTNLDRMGIECRLETSVREVEAGTVRLSSGEAIGNALLIWTAGVQTPEFVRNLPVAKSKQGRVEVDGCLRIAENCFVAGDAAQFVSRGSPLRMSVQFALTEGWLAGRNIVRAVRGREPRPFIPRDPGYLVPMANNRSCGIVLGVTVTGFPATLLHYVMCIFRSRGVARRLKMLKELKRIF